MHAPRLGETRHRFLRAFYKTTTAAQLYPRADATRALLHLCVSSYSPFPDRMSLDRFLTAQASARSGFTTALAELQAGRKTSHWIWYIFPQLAVLGRSSTAKFYGLADPAEAAAYLRNPTLRGNLLMLLDVVALQLAKGMSLNTLMNGSTDSLKLVSCLTLFEYAAVTLNENEPSADLVTLAQRCAEILSVAAQQGYPRCQTTLGEIG